MGDFSVEVTSVLFSQGLWLFLDWHWVLLERAKLLLLWGMGLEASGYCDKRAKVPDFVHSRRLELSWVKNYSGFSEETLTLFYRSYSHNPEA